MAKTLEQLPLHTRAVALLVEAGDIGFCDWTQCPEPSHRIKFTARRKDRWVVANVYGRNGNDSEWDHVEHYHPACYANAGEPHGEVIDRVRYRSGAATRRR